MRILHYTIGLPPLRHGGLVQYVLDLSKAQKNAGDEVFLLFPGPRSLWPGSYIKSVGIYRGIPAYCIVNATDVPVSGGVRKPERLWKPCISLKDNQARDLLSKLRPEVLHIHSWLGFPPVLLGVARELGIRTVYTTHDFFGLCPCMHFLDYQGMLCYQPEAKKCALCCLHGPGSFELFWRSQEWLMPLLPYLKRMRALWHRLISPRSKNRNEQPSQVNEDSVQAYRKLNQYYSDLFSHIDFFHFNSEQSASWFRRLLPSAHGKVIEVSNASIEDKRQLRKTPSLPLRLGYLGGMTEGKGLEVLWKACSLLLRNNQKEWTLLLWGVDWVPDELSAHCFLQPDFKREQMDALYGGLDLVIVPSTWPETFGMVVSEAMARGVPVLASSLVGAKSRVSAVDTDFVYGQGAEELASRLQYLLEHPSRLGLFNERCLNRPFVDSMIDQAVFLKEAYTQGVLDG